MAANTGATMAADLGGAQATATTTTTTALVAMAGHEANLCGYDSYLHKTICAAAANGGVGAATAMHLTTAHAASATAAINGGVQALATSTPNRLLQHHFHHSKLKRLVLCEKSAKDCLLIITFFWFELPVGRNTIAWRQLWVQLGRPSRRR